MNKRTWPGLVLPSLRSSRPRCGLPRCRGRFSSASNERMELPRVVMWKSLRHQSTPVTRDVYCESDGSSDDRAEQGVERCSEQGLKGVRSRFSSIESADRSSSDDCNEQRAVIALLRSLCARASSADASRPCRKSRTALWAGPCIWRDGISAIVTINHLQQSILMFCQRHFRNGLSCARLRACCFGIPWPWRTATAGAFFFSAASHSSWCRV